MNNQLVIRHAYDEDTSPDKRSAKLLQSFFEKHTLEWVQYGEEPYIIAGSLCKAKGVDSKDFSKNYIDKITGSSNDSSSGSEKENHLLDGIIKCEGELLSCIKSLFEEQNGYKPTWSKARSIYICEWFVAVHYLSTGYSDVALDITGLGAQLIQDKVETLSNNSLSVLEQLHATTGLVIKELKDQSQRIDNINARLNALEDVSSYISIQQLGIDTNTVFTPLIARLLGNKCRAYCLENDIHFKYYYSSRANEYKRDVISKVFRDGVQEKVFYIKNEHGTFFAWASSEPSPLKHKPKPSNYYRGVEITSFMIVRLVPAFIKGYNSVHGTNYNQYNIWRSVLHLKIEELCGISIKQLKEYGIGSLAPLKSTCKLPILYEYMLPYIQKGNELLDQQKEASLVTNSAERLRKIKAAEQTTGNQT